jgi:hypothetical protein
MLSLFGRVFDCVAAGSVSCVFDVATANFSEFIWFFILSSAVLLLACVYLRSKLSILKRP